MLAGLLELKDDLGITDDASNAKLLRMLRSADLYVKNRLKRPLIEEATLTELYDGYGKNEIVLRRYPVTDLTDVRYDTLRVFGTDTIVEATDYELHIEGDNGILRFLSSWSDCWWGYDQLCTDGASYRGGRSTLQVTYTAGYPEDGIPADLSRAVIKVAGQDYLASIITATTVSAGGGTVKQVRRGQSQITYATASEGSSTSGTTRTSVKDPYGIDDLLAPYKDWRRP